MIHTQRDEVVVGCWLPAADDCAQVISRRHPCKRHKSPDKKKLVLRRKKAELEEGKQLGKLSVVRYGPLVKGCLTLSSCGGGLPDRCFTCEGKIKKLRLLLEIIGAKNAKWPVQE